MQEANNNEKVNIKDQISKNLELGLLACGPNTISMVWQIRFSLDDKQLIAAC